VSQTGRDRWTIFVCEICGGGTCKEVEPRCTCVDDLCSPGDGIAVVAAPSPTTVIHRRDMRPGDVFIGRPSIWGNPFKIGRDGDRDQVIALYRRWIASQPALLARVPELHGKRLACFCAPRACHGDVLAELADA
jgi:hypothetical protein